MQHPVAYRWEFGSLVCALLAPALVQDLKKVFVVGCVLLQVVHSTYHASPLLFTCFAHVLCLTVVLVTGSPVFLCAFLFSIFGRVSVGADVEPGVILISASAVTHCHLLFAYTLIWSHAEVLSLPLPAKQE